MIKIATATTATTTTERPIEAKIMEEITERSPFAIVEDPDDLFSKPMTAEDFTFPLHEPFQGFNFEKDPDTGKHRDRDRDRDRESTKKPVSTTRQARRLDMSGTAKRPNANRPKPRLYICPDCSLEMMYSNIDGSGCYFCDDCGGIEEIIGDNSEIIGGGAQHTSNAVSGSYNTNNASTIPLKMVGPNAGLYQRRVTSSTANYKNTQRMNTYQDMTRYAMQYQGAEVPPHLIKLAAEEFCRLQNYFIKRGDVRRGIMGCLVYEACHDNNIDRTSKEIADMFETTQSELSRGSKLVKEARASGLLEPEKNQGYALQDDMHAKMERYFSLFDIPTDDGKATGHPNYWGFVETLILFAHARRKKSWHSGMKARCAGAMYILGLQAPELGLTKKAIADRCEISSPTFMRFSNILIDVIRLTASNKTRRMLMHIYKTHGLPIPERR